LSTHRLFALANVDASPHTNYLFRFLKSDLRAWRRQKRNFNRDSRFVNPFETSEVEDFRIPGPPTCGWHPARRPRSLAANRRVSTANFHSLFSLFRRGVILRRRPFEGRAV